MFRKLKVSVLLLLLTTLFLSLRSGNIKMRIDKIITVDSLGAAQGVARHGNSILVYGDREVGIIRDYRMISDSLTYTGKEYRLTVGGKDIINHPTGIAYNGSNLTFIGNTTKLPGKNNDWKAEIFCVNWEGLLKTGTLDGNIISRIDDDICIQGSRPEYVKYKGKWYVATADYGNRGNEVRLYDPRALQKAKGTTDKGVLFKKFTCSPWVQTLHWIEERGILVLIQNQVAGKKWRFTYIDLARSVDTGKQVILNEIDMDERPDELEGFTMLEGGTKAIAVSSAKKENLVFTSVIW